MSNIFVQIVNDTPVTARLEFGHNDNVIIEAIDFGTRTAKNGMKLNMNTFIKLSKVDPEKERKVIASSEVNFFNLNHEKDFVFNNVISQFTTLGAIIDATGGDLEKFEEAVMSNFTGDEDDAKKALKSADFCIKIQTAMQDAFKLQLDGKTGEKSDLLKCKMTVNKSGYVEASGELDWILPMTSTDSLPAISSDEKRNYKKSLVAKDEKKSPDKVGTSPGEAKVTSSANMLGSL